MGVRDKMKKVLRTEVEKEEAAVVELYSRIYVLKKELKKLEGTARDRATDLYEGEGLMALTGDEGVVAVKKRESYLRVDSKKVKTWFDANELDIREVQSEAKATMVFSFSPRNEK